MPSDKANTYPRNASAGSLVESTASSEVVNLLDASSFVLEDSTAMQLSGHEVALLSATESSSGISAELVASALLAEALSS